MQPDNNAAIVQALMGGGGQRGGPQPPQVEAEGGDAMAILSKLPPEVLQKLLMMLEGGQGGQGPAPEEMAEGEMPA